MIQPGRTGGIVRPLALAREARGGGSSVCGVVACPGHDLDGGRASGLAVWRGAAWSEGLGKISLIWLE
jgi:hypothetical protein